MLANLNKPSVAVLGTRYPGHTVSKAQGITGVNLCQQKKNVWPNE